MHIHPLFTQAHARPIAAETEDQATQPDIYLPLLKIKKSGRISRQARREQNVNPPAATAAKHFNQR